MKHSVIGSTGIGYYTALSLARKGAKVYMAARNEAKATEAIQKMESEGFAPGNGSIQWWKLDLSHPKSAEESAAEFVKKEARLDILGISDYYYHQVELNSYSIVSSE